jgi:hypothetical protein
MLSTAMASTAGSWGYTRKITVKETVILVGQADYDSDTEPLKIRGAGTGRENVWRMLKVARGAGARIKTLAITGAEGPELNIPAADCPFLGSRSRATQPAMASAIWMRLSRARATLTLHSSRNLRAAAMAWGWEAATTALESGNSQG